MLFTHKVKNVKTCRFISDFSLLTALENRDVIYVRPLTCLYADSGLRVCLQFKVLNITNTEDWEKNIFCRYTI